jgi:hypothetical protein
MTAPKNAITLPGGFRAYRWTDAETGEKTDVLSVTSIRRYCGEPFRLVNWKIANVVNVAMGVRSVERIGPRGGKKKVYVQDGDFPGQFVTKMLASEGETEELARVRHWLNQNADEPRDRPATRGTVVHEAIEGGIRPRDITQDYVEAAFARDHNILPVGEEDVAFVRDCLRQHADMRNHVPYVILARELQVWNLTAGYAGSFDVLLWLLPEGTNELALAHWQGRADAGKVTLDEIRVIGGEIVLGDYKTSPEVYTDHVTQVTAYMAAEFVGTDGKKDPRLTEILNAAMNGALIQIRPDFWSIDFCAFTEPVLQAFLGSCIFARFLAQHDSPKELFTKVLKGKAT